MLRLEEPSVRSKRTSVQFCVGSIEPPSEVIDYEIIRLNFCISMYILFAQKVCRGFAIHLLGFLYSPSLI
jgi:hypothetical protein